MRTITRRLFEKSVLFLVLLGGKIYKKWSVTWVWVIFPIHPFLNAITSLTSLCAAPSALRSEWHSNVTWLSHMLTRKRLPICHPYPWSKHCDREHPRSQPPRCVPALCDLCADHERVRRPCGDRPVSSMMASSSNNHIQDNATGLWAHRPVFSSPSMALENKQPSSLFSTNNSTKIHITSPSYTRVAVSCPMTWFISEPMMKMVPN